MNMKFEIKSTLFLAVLAFSGASHAQTAAPVEPPEPSVVLTDGVPSAVAPPAVAAPASPASATPVPAERAATTAAALPNDPPGVLAPTSGAPKAAPPPSNAPRVIALNEAPSQSLDADAPVKSKTPRMISAFKGAVRTSFDVNTVWDLDDRYQLFDSSDVNVRMGVSVGYDLLSFDGGWVVAPELGWSHESASDGPLAPQLSQKELRGDHFFGAFRARHTVASWLEGFGRLQGGMAWTRVDLASSGASVDQYSTDDKAPEFQLGAGLVVRTPDAERAPPGESLALGFTLEAGYQVAPALKLKLERVATEGQRISVLTSDLGTLSRSGPCLRLGVFARF